MLLGVGQKPSKVLLREISSEEFSDIALSYRHTRSYRNYQNAYFTGFSDLSFALVLNSKVLAIIFVAAKKSEDLGYYDGPIEIVYSDQLSLEEKNRVAQSVKAEIEIVASENSSDSVMITDDLHLMGCFFAPGISISTRVHAIVPLENSEDAVLQGVRKSYRSLINWGRKNLREVVIDSGNPDRDLFYAFKSLHIRVAGRQTRSDETWDLQYQGILDGHVYLILGFLDQALVAGVLNFSSKNNAYYAVAVNDRNLMSENKPLGHSLVLSSILYAKKTGCSLYDLGDVGSAVEVKKNLDIAVFKKGFTQNLVIQNSMRCQIN